MRPKAMTRVLSKVSESFNTLEPPEDDFERHRKASGGIATHQYFDDVLPIGESEVREALMREAKRHKHWRASAVSKMEFQSLEQSACLRYTLESYTEYRSTMETVEAYVAGANIDAADFGSVSILGEKGDLNPWDFEIQPTNLFVDQVRMMEMPGTSKISDCMTCRAEGTMHCFHCRGSGADKCGFCRGTGMKAGVAHPAVYTHPMIATFPHADTSRGYSSNGTAMLRHGSGPSAAYGLGTPMHFMSKTGVPPPGIGTHDLCYMCHGRGVSECAQCRGSGKKPCSKCGGSGSVRSFTKMKVFFRTERSEFFTACPVPERQLAHVTGTEIYADEQPYVMPITKYAVAEINEHSKRLCAEHLQKCIGVCRVIKQRHSLLAIPVVQVNYAIGKHSGTCFIFGRERACYVPKYPSKCTLL